MESPVGPLFLAASQGGLIALEFDRRLPGQQTIRPNPRDLRGERKKVQFEESAQALGPYVAELHQYFAGRRRKFDFPLDLRGTDFQLACWRALLAVPYGQTRSYAEIARAVGRPRGFRAVGMANIPLRSLSPAIELLRLMVRCAGTVAALKSNEICWNWNDRK